MVGNVFRHYNRTVKIILSSPRTIYIYRTGYFKERNIILSLSVCLSLSLLFPFSVSLSAALFSGGIAAEREYCKYNSFFSLFFKFMRRMEINSRMFHGVIALFAIVFAIFMPAVHGHGHESMAPAPSPTSDG